MKKIIDFVFNKKNFLLYINCFCLFISVLTEFFGAGENIEKIMVPLFVIPAFGVCFYFIAFTSLFDILKFKEVGKLKKAEIIISIINLVILVHIWFCVLYKI